MPKERERERERERDERETLNGTKQIVSVVGSDCCQRQNCDLHKPSCVSFANDFGPHTAQNPIPLAFSKLQIPKAFYESCQRVFLHSEHA